ncbi:cAMP-responsive element modulator-like isoform X2 [Spea bombifrons]|uniref:cAMP-responsive element modulator-like isoform X2 n=1 Tax=Spea bombifrons TaxID=233779 RepID=UPI00234B4CBF|nr:cAMP-responsive element modulator-like isoform X2 [Spea bombifrons]
MEAVESQHNGGEGDAGYFFKKPEQAEISGDDQGTIVDVDDSLGSPGGVDPQTHTEVITQSSYETSFNDPSPNGTLTPTTGDDTFEEEGTESPLSTTGGSATISSLYHTNTGQYIAISQGGRIHIAGPGSEGLQTLIMGHSGASQPGTAIMQYAAQSPDSQRQFYVPGTQIVLQAAGGDIPAYEIRTPSSALSQGVLVASSPSNMHNPEDLAEEATRKREMRLMKNREAAKECRRRKNEYVRCLERRVAMLEMENKKLMAELEKCRKA